MTGFTLAQIVAGIGESTRFHGRDERASTPAGDLPTPQLRESQRTIGRLEEIVRAQQQQGPREPILDRVYDALARSAKHIERLGEIATEAAQTPGGRQAFAREDVLGTAAISLRHADALSKNLRARLQSRGLLPADKPDAPADRGGDVISLDAFRRRRRSDYCKEHGLVDDDEV